MLLNLFKGPYSVKDIALGMIETIRAMVISLYEEHQVVTGQSRF